MKPRVSNQKTAALTLAEVFVVIVVLVVLAAVLLRPTSQRYPSFRSRCVQNLKQVGLEWRLVKTVVIAWSAFPIAAAMGDFDELSPGLIEQGILLGSTFERARLAPVGAGGHRIPGQTKQ